MKIILVAANARGKNLVFISDALQAYTLQNAVRLTKAGDIEDIYPVYRTTSVYLRTKPSVPPKEHLDRISISSYQLFSAPDNLNHALSTPIFGNYWSLYRHSLKESGGPFIIIDDYALITKREGNDKITAPPRPRFHRGKKI